LVLTFQFLKKIHNDLNSLKLILHYFQFTLLIDNQQLKENLSKLEKTQDKSEEMNNILKGTFKMI